MTVQKVTADTLPVFRAWLAESRRPIGVVISGRGLLAFADTIGGSWEVPLTARTDAAVRLAIAACAAFGSRRSAWADDGTVVALQMARTLGVGVAQVAFIKDLGTLRFALDPEREAPARGGSLDARARAIAREVDALRAEFTPELREVAMVSVRQELLWRHRQLVGWPVDVRMNGREMEKAEADRQAAAAELGIDLTIDNAATMSWITSRGVTLTSLSRSDYRHAVVPPEAAEVWATFRRVRSIKSRLSKVREFQRALTREGRIHSRYTVHGTVTGRATSAHVALQNLQGGLRPLLTASRGRELIGLDLSRAEVAIAAAMSGDQDLQLALLSADVYEELAVKIYGVSARGDTELRAICKRVLLAGLLYGMGARALGKELGLSVEEAAAIIKGMHAAYPVLSAFLAATIAASDGVAWHFTAYGRPLPRTLITENCQGEKVRQPAGYRAPNWRVQGTGADVLIRGVERVVERFGVEALVLAVHDEVLIEVDPEEVAVQQAMAALEEAMTAELNSVTITGTAVHVGKAWRKT